MNAKLTTFFFLTVATLAAQTTTAPAGGTGNTSTAVQAKLQSFASSLSYFSAQDFTQGEAVLEQANVQQMGTPSWNKESAFDLIRVAHYFGNVGNPALAYAIAKLALNHLAQEDQSYTASSNPAEVANEKELQAQLYEQYFGDRASAEKYYAAAIALSPSTTSLAVVALTRLQQMDAFEAQKRAYAASVQ